MISGCYDFFCRIDCSDRPRSSIKRYNIYCSWASAIILSVAFTGCGADEESAPSDAASDAGELSDSGQNRAALVCVNDNDCSDSLYCNGTEYCSPTNPQADEMGCVGGESPCLATQTCEEEEKRCVTQCTTERDADGDGYQAIECGGDDCDDSDADRFPGNEELCDATHDEDCDPTTFGQRDWDEDGFTDALCCNEDEQGEKYCGDDCNDFDSTTHPMATEVCDEIDNDCDSETDEDKRIDGFEDNDRDRHGNPDKPMQACAGSSGFSEKSDDCDDEQPTVHAAQQEFCDEIDNDCDGDVDEDAQPVTWYRDQDGDSFGSEQSGTVQSCEPVPGYSILPTDCDDRNASINPGADELCDGIDNDCDDYLDEGSRHQGFFDLDQDGYGDSDYPRIGCLNDPEFSRQGGDCDDSRWDVHPDRVESCDAIDNDCDGDTDEALRMQGFVDADYDLHGDPDEPITGCIDVPGFSLLDDDCDDENPAVHGNQPELCDGIDNDCDGEVDEEAVPVTWYRDADGDGFGQADGETKVSCEQPDGYSLLPFDCNDRRAGINPRAEELCDGIDNDCNGVADYSIGEGNLEDDDADGFADLACGSVGNDCNDQRASDHPGAEELCDGFDNDCDGQVDEDTEEVQWYLDRDRDGYGDQDDEPITSCPPIQGRVKRAGDCDDANPQIHPGIVDLCDGTDQDCDGQTDEDALQFALYADEDGDGFFGGEALWLCDGGDDYGSIPADCDDTHADIHPGASEECDGVDNDCDEQVDEGVKVSAFIDADGDLHGDPNRPIDVCTVSAGYATEGDDCDDTRVSVHAAQVEVCDGLDNDCDGETDEGAEPIVWYRDLDGDGFGAEQSGYRESCAPLAGYSILSTDCDDNTSSINPSREEICDGLDNNCDGETDENLRDLHPEVCDGELDEDCDGEIDEGCECVIGRARSCGSDEGVCEPGIQACVPPGVWGNCVEAITGSEEVCNDKDDDCDGETDEDGSGGTVC